VATWLRESGFTVRAEVVFAPEETVPGAALFAQHR
jgi:hypothetical protein